MLLYRFERILQGRHVATRAHILLPLIDREISTLQPLLNVLVQVETLHFLTQSPEALEQNNLRSKAS